MPNDNHSFQIHPLYKILALWTAVTFLYIYGDYFELYVPGKINSLQSGENLLNSPQKLFLTSIIMSLPPLCIGISLIIKAKVARIVNIVVASIFTLFTLLVGISSVSLWNTFYVFSSFLESILTGVIILHAIKWKPVS